MDRQRLERCQLYVHNSRPLVKLQLEGRGHPTAHRGIGGPAGKFLPAFGLTTKKNFFWGLGEGLLRLPLHLIVPPWLFLTMRL